MPCIEYVPKVFKGRRAALIEHANAIITEYAEQGFALTLRQLYYQFVARDLLPNTQREYKNLGNLVSDARRAGLVDWLAIEDRTRFVRRAPTWDDPSDIIDDAAEQYRTGKWDNIRVQPEVWVEKDALVGVFEDACRELDVPLFSCRGYPSDSEVWRAACRVVQRQADEDQYTVVLHFGDHDPSGIDMSRDIEDRLRLFGAGGSAGDSFVVRRVALNMEQVDEYGPPPNPAKVTDSRFENYRVVYGEDSWELDALEPRVLADLVRSNVDELIEAEDGREAWDEAHARQDRERELLAAVRDRWSEVVEFIEAE